MIKFILQKLRQNFSSLFTFLLLALCLWAIAHELRNYNYHDVLNSFNSLPKTRLSLAILFTTLGYLIMIPYDILGFNYLNCQLAWNKIAFTNFLSSVFSNTIGFAIITGSAIRYRFYSTWGVPALVTTQVIAFANFTFWLGMFATAGIMFLANPLQIPNQLHLPLATTRPIGIIFLILIFLYLLASILIKQPLVIRSQEFRFPSFNISLAQIAVSSLDWVFAAAALYVLLPSNAALSYLDFLGIYLLGMFAGVVSNVPGGLGVFETVILLILSAKISAPAILGAMLAYRGVYYFLPLLIAAGMLGFYEIKHRKNS